MLVAAPEVRFTVDDAQKASDEWGFNCGPGALCAVLGMTPDEIRPHLGDFESKRYTNPTLMASILRNLGVRFYRYYEARSNFTPDVPDNSGRCWGTNPIYPTFGLVRVQWGGPWTKPDVPVQVRYRHTHWIAVRKVDTDDETRREAFDVNAICEGGWLPWSEWADQLVPWLLKQAEPKGDGRWWMTHGWEIVRN